jgi:hypothetical protein
MLQQEVEDTVGLRGRCARTVRYSSSRPGLGNLALKLAPLLLRRHELAAKVGQPVVLALS